MPLWQITHYGDTEGGPNQKPIGVVWGMGLQKQFSFFDNGSNSPVKVDWGEQFPSNIQTGLIKLSY